MAITRRFQARATVTQATHSQLVTSAAALRKQHIEIVKSQANADGTVTVTLAGRGLGPKATPAAPPVNVSIENGEVKILPLEEIMTAPYGIVSIHNDYSYATGWTARMVYCLPASEVAAFLEDNYLAEYTASVKMAVVKITDEPWMEGDVVLSAGTSQTRKVTLHFGIVYLDVPWPSNLTRPDYTEGTTLKLHVNYASEYMPLKGRSLKPSSGPTPGPDTQEALLICQDEYRIEWDRVQDLDDLDFDGYVGYVNESDFLQEGDAGTLLVVGVPIEPTYVLNPANPCSWKATVTIRKRAVTVADGDNAGTYGWNDWYNPQTQQWEAIELTNGAPKYPTTDFSGLFS